MNFYALFRCFCFSQFFCAVFPLWFHKLQKTACSHSFTHSRSRSTLLVPQWFRVSVSHLSAFYRGNRTRAHIREFIQSNHMHPIKVMAWNIHWIYVKHNTYMHLFTQQIEHRNCLVFTMLLAMRKALGIALYLCLIHIMHLRPLIF